MFDRSRLQIEPLSARQHDLSLSDILPLEADIPAMEEPKLAEIAQRIRQARARGAAVMLIMGAHLLRRGNSRYIIDLMERGILTHIAMNGAGPIHDFEFALIGATTESVARYIRTGQFGMWRETGHLNEIARQAVSDGIGLGEAIGLAIEEGGFPYRDISILAAGYRLQVPVTVHVGIGQDIIHQHPNCDGAALGETSYRDFLIFVQSVTNLEGGVLLNFGSAVMGPEVYLKALSMARNVARQEGKQIAHFTTAVFDLPDLGDDFEAEPPKTDPRYYYRPWKTILVRTVADGGESFYVQGDHRQTFPNLWKNLRD
jgi:nucleotide-binding universal stress UspA family protein